MSEPNVVTTEPELSKAARHLIFDLVMEIAQLHPEANLIRRPHIGSECVFCQRVAEAMKYLYDNQRQYGPAIDVTDPSYRVTP